MYISRRGSGKKRILLVNASFDSFRTYEPRQIFVAAATAIYYLAGSFHPDLCEVRTHCEVAQGLLTKESDFAWADMLVLSGTTNSMDRMRQLTAYARTKNPNVIVVAGGPAVRMMPKLARASFDYACDGDLEQIEDVIIDAFGPDYMKPGIVPRFDLHRRIDGVGCIETSRNCNFGCSFCSLTAEGGKYQTYSADFIRAQIEAMGKRTYICIQDNNFYGNNRASFRERLSILKEYYEKGYFRGWVALLTSDFFADDENIRLAKEAGCFALFCGVESFQPDMIERFSKKQNRSKDRFEAARKCLDHGIIFDYGLIFDAAHQTIESFRADIDDICSRDDITTPGYICLAAPLPGTPLFHEIAAEGGFLPNVRLRDIDSDTLVVWPKDPLDEVADYVRGLNSLRDHRGAFLGQLGRFLVRRRKDLSAAQLFAVASKLIYRVTYDSSPMNLLGRRPRRSCITTTEPLDRPFTPAFPVDARYADMFEPTMVTNRKGEVILEDLQSPPKPRGLLPPKTGLNCTGLNATPMHAPLELATPV
ncbi:B12-binding domain-containing radical SAM protein [Azospirillum sp. sgz302134]